MTTTESLFDSLPVQQDANTRISVDRLPLEPNNFPTIGNGTNVIYNHTYYNCTSPLDNINFRDAKIVGSLLPLGVVCLMVILGNIMVITAIRITKKLRGATNMFIVSLAWADLMLGILVLPFSAMYEVFNMWLFGKVWCSIWLAVDVWMCTASILHLVVISLDRYIAVTQPMKYPNLMTSKKAKLLITGAWILSFVICFPPLVGWTDNKDEDDGTNSDLNNTQSTLLIDEMKKEFDEMDERCNPQCMLNQEPGYVIYSAVGSFYAPMLVMMFFNWRIYQTAKKTTKAIRQGWTRVKGTGDEVIGLGIHRGGGASVASTASANNRTTTNKQTNGSSRSSGATGGVHQLTSTADSRQSSTRLVGNGLVPRDLDKVSNASAAASAAATTMANRSRASTFACASGNPVASTGNNNSNSSPRFKRNLLPQASVGGARSSQGGINSRLQRESLMMPRSASSSLISTNMKNQNSSIINSNNCHNSKSSSAHSYLSYGTKSAGSAHSRSKSMANMAHHRVQHSQQTNTFSVGPSAEVNHDGEPLEAAEAAFSHHGHHHGLHSLYTAHNASDSPEPLPKVSQHQPCPNHVGGKTFAEIGTQTFPKHKKQHHPSSNGGGPESVSDSSLSTLGCAAGIRQRLRLVKTPGESNDTEHDQDPDCHSLGSAVAGNPAGKPTSCFRCHPRRWRHQACCFRRTHGSHKTGHHTKKNSSFSGRAAGGIARIGRGGDADSDPGSILNTSNHDLQVIPMGGAVAAMISAAVNQSANMAHATTSGSGKGQLPPRSTFGKRNIKNQVRRFRMETKAAKTLGIIVGCFICCWFPFFTMYLVTAFCADCIPKLVFSVIFWLGYCNSAINPFIYAAFSRDFRGAFKKIICKVLCRRESEPPRGIFMALHPRNVSLGVAAVAVAAAAAADPQPSGGVAETRAQKGGATGTTITSASN